MRFMLLSTLFLCIGLVLATGAPARAHTEIVSSQPERGEELRRPPERVRLFFEGPVEAEFSPLEVYDARGERVDEDNAGVDPEDPTAVIVDLKEGLPAGNYTVEYRYTGADGHVIDGSYEFAASHSAGEPAGEPAQVVEEPAGGEELPQEEATGGGFTSVIPSVLRPAEEQFDNTHLPARLSEVVHTNTWQFKRKGGLWTINGKIYNKNRIDEVCAEGETEIWEFSNNSGGWVHPVHVHLLNFKIIERDGGKPPHPWERGWKDTIFLGPNESAKVLLKWPKVPLGPEPTEFVRRYPFHCHNLEHEDHDMMLQFKVAAGEEEKPPEREGPGGKRGSRARGTARNRRLARLRRRRRARRARARQRR